MKSLKGFALGLALGVAVAVGTVGLAQSTKPADQTPKAESCCCHGGSCAMHSADQEHMKAQLKQHSGEGGCCCCGGDSCDMKMHEKMKENKQ